VQSCVQPGTGKPVRIGFGYKMSCRLVPSSDKPGNEAKAEHA